MIATAFFDHATQLRYLFSRIDFDHDAAPRRRRNATEHVASHMSTPTSQPRQETPADSDDRSDAVIRHCCQCHQPVFEDSVLCPMCEASLNIGDPRAYAPQKTRLARIVAAIALVLFVGSMLLLFGILVTRPN